MDTESPNFTQPAEASGSLLEGCGLGCACQAVFFLLGLAAAYSAANRLTTLLWTGWGFTQWIALIPLIFQQRAKGHPKTVQGILISGFLGMLLSSACAAMVLSR